MTIFHCYVSSPEGTPGWEYETHWEPTSPTACRPSSGASVAPSTASAWSHRAKTWRWHTWWPVAHGKPMQLGCFECFGPTKHKHVKKIQKGSWRRTVLKSVEGTNPNIQNCDHNKDDDGTSNDTNDYVRIYISKYSTKQPKDRKKHKKPLPTTPTPRPSRKEKTNHQQLSQTIAISISAHLSPAKKKRKLRLYIYIYTYICICRHIYHIYIYICVCVCVCVCAFVCYFYLFIEFYWSIAISLTSRTSRDLPRDILCFFLALPFSGASPSAALAQSLQS